MFDSEFLTNTDDGTQRYKQLIADAAEIVAKFWPGQPYSGKTPTDLAKLVPDNFLPDASRSPAELSNTLQAVVSDSISVTHPHTAAHLHCPPLLASLAAEVVITALNQSMDSFDQAPIATIVEQKVIRWLCSEVGLPTTADGTFTTGGSQSNYMALLLARDSFLQRDWNWSAQKSGLPPDARKLRILCSDVAHFTVEKSAHQLGLGTDAVVRVPVDDQFRMIPRALRDLLDGLRQQNLLPMSIVATAGTTDFGSVDPLPEVTAEARRTGAWLHVDAAYGGVLLFSAEHRDRLKGIEEADSISVDFHKLFWQPIPCSVVLVRDAKTFDLIKMHADYLNPELHEEEGVPDLVTKSLLTSRRFDALKLWMSLQSLGRTKLAAMIDRTIALAACAAEIIGSAPQLELICEPQLSTVVFRYTPKNGDPDRLNSLLRQRLFEKGTAVVGHTRVRGRQALKFTCMNPTASESDFATLIQMIVDEGEALESDHQASSG